MKRYRANMRRAGGRIHRSRYTLDFILDTTNEILEARDLPPLGGMRTDADTTTDDGA